MLAQCEHGGNFVSYLRQVKENEHAAKTVPTLKQIRLALRRLQLELETLAAEQENGQSQGEDIVISREELAYCMPSERDRKRNLAANKAFMLKLHAVVFRMQRIANTWKYRGIATANQMMWEASREREAVRLGTELSEVVDTMQQHGVALDAQVMQAVNTFRNSVQQGQLSHLIEAESVVEFSRAG